MAIGEPARLRCGHGWQATLSALRQPSPRNSDIVAIDEDGRRLEWAIDSSSLRQHNALDRPDGEWCVAGWTPTGLFDAVAARSQPLMASGPPAMKRRLETG